MARTLEFHEGNTDKCKQKHSVHFFFNDKYKTKYKHRMRKLKSRFFKI